jgi:hypothetical protein
MAKKSRRSHPGGRHQRLLRAPSAPPKWQRSLLRALRFTSVLLAIFGAVVILTDWIDWPWWVGLGLGSPLGFLVFLDDGFASHFDIADDVSFDGGFWGDGFGDGGGSDGGGGG